MSLFDLVSSQFEKPRGLLGRLAGRIMATRPSNIERNNWTLSLLDIKPSDRVLEIGYGPGIAIGAVAEAASEAVGVDHSSVMYNAATERNKELIRRGKLTLKIGSIVDQDSDLGLFDKIFTVNVVQFWGDPVAVFRKLHGYLNRGGRIVTSYEPRHPGATDNDAYAKADEIAEWLRQAGFDEIRIEKKMMKPVAAVAVVASVE